MPNILDYQLQLDAASFTGGTKAVNSGLGDLSSTFAGVTDRVGAFGDEMMGLKSSMEDGVKGVFKTMSSVEKLTGASEGFTKKSRILDKMNLKQIATYGLLHKNYTRTAKVFDKFMNAQGVMEKKLFKVNKRYTDTKDVIFKLGDHLQSEAPRYMEKITDHWESLTAAILASTAALRAYQFGDKFTRMNKAIALSNDKMKELQDLSLKTSSTLQVGSGELADQFLHMYKQGVRSSEAMQEIATATNKLEIAAGPAAEQTNVLFTKLVGLGQIDPKSLERVSSGILAVKNVSAATAEEILGMGDIVSRTMLRLGPLGAQTEDVMGAMAKTAAMTQNVFEDDVQGLGDYMQSLTDLSEGGLERASKLVAVLNTLGRHIGVEEGRALITQGKFDVITKEIAAGFANLDTSSAAGQIAMHKLGEALGKDYDFVAKLSQGFKVNREQMDAVSKAWDEGSQNSNLLNAEVAKQNKTLERMSEQLKVVSENIHTKLGMAVKRVTRPIMEMSHALSLNLLKQLDQVPAEAYLAAGGMTVLASVPVTKWAFKTAADLIFVRGSVKTLNSVLRSFPGASQKFASATKVIFGSSHMLRAELDKTGQVLTYVLRDKAGGWFLKEGIWKATGRGIGVAARGMSVLAKGTGAFARGVASVFGANYDELGNLILKDGEKLGFLARQFDNAATNMSTFARSTNTMSGALEYGASKAARFQNMFGRSFFTIIKDKLVGLAQWISKGFVQLITLGDVESRLGKFLTSLIGKFGQLLSTVGGAWLKLITKPIQWLAAAFGLLSKRSETFTGVVKALGGAIGRFVLAPIMLVSNVVLAITAGIYAAAFALKWVNKGLAYVVDALKSAPKYIEKAFDFLSNIIPWIGDMFVKMIDDIPGMLFGALAYAGKEGGLSLVTNLVGYLAQIPYYVYKIMGVAFMGALKVVFKALGYVPIFLLDVLGSVVGAVADMLVGLGDALGDALLWGWNQLTNVVLSGQLGYMIYDAAVATFDGIGNYISKWWTDIMVWMGTKWVALGEKLEEVWLKVLRLYYKVTGNTSELAVIEYKLARIEGNRAKAAQDAADAAKKQTNEIRTQQGLLNKNQGNFFKNWMGGHGITAAQLGIKSLARGQSALGQGGVSYRPETAASASLASTDSVPIRPVAGNQQTVAQLAAARYANDALDSLNKNNEKTNTLLQVIADAITKPDPQSSSLFSTNRNTSTNYAKIANAVGVGR